MIKNILECEFKYEDNKLYRFNKKHKKWSCCNDLKPNKDVYIRILINKKKYALHRIIYKYHNEDWDLTYSYNNEIDHININPLDNRIENLRVVNHTQNSINRNKFKNCSSKYKGVCWDKQKNKWRASIRINSKTKNLGLFTNEEEAYECYKKKYDELMNI